MIKKIKISKTTGTQQIPITISEINNVTEIKQTQVDLCTLVFPNEDMNKLVEKLNEVINTINKC